MPEPIDDVSGQIGRQVAELVHDGDCLQLGIGGIPIVDLVEAGVIDCCAKNYRPRKVICSFVMGTRRLDDFVADNPFIESYGNDYVNDPFVIARNDNMVSINSALASRARVWSPAAATFGSSSASSAWPTSMQRPPVSVRVR